MAASQSASPCIAQKAVHLTVTGEPGLDVVLNGVVVDAAGFYRVEVESGAGTGNYGSICYSMPVTKTKSVTGVDNGSLLTAENLNLAPMKRDGRACRGGWLQLRLRRRRSLCD